MIDTSALPAKPGYGFAGYEQDGVVIIDANGELQHDLDSLTFATHDTAACMYHGELYNLYNNECVQVCPYEEYADETGSMKWNATTKKCEYSCIEGFIKQ